MSSLSPKSESESLQNDGVVFLRNPYIDIERRKQYVPDSNTRVCRETEIVRHPYHSESSFSGQSPISIVEMEDESPINLKSASISPLKIAKTKIQATPSEGLPGSSVRFDAIEAAINKIKVVPLEQQLKRVKELGYCVEVKRHILKRLAAQREKPSSKIKMISYFTLFKYSIQMRFNSMVQHLISFFYSLNIWRYSLKQIEGHFGSGVTSYFEFLQWLIMMNIPTFILIFAFVILPQLLSGGSSLVNEAILSQHSQFYGLELLTGGNSFTNSILYYGGYSKDIRLSSLKHKYHMKYAYLATICCYYLITLIVLATSLSKSYKRNFIDSQKSHSSFYSIRVFSSYDYNINRTTYTDSNFFYNEIKNRLDSEKNHSQGNTLCQWVVVLLKRIAVNIVVISLLAASYIAVDRVANSSDYKGFWHEMKVPFVVSALNLLVPLMFSKLAILEDFSTDFTVTFLGMTRTIALNVITLVALLKFWYGTVNCATNPSSNCNKCWENFMGREIFKLVIIDFIFTIVVTIGSEFIWSFFAMFTSFGKPKFDICRNTLNLIYSQALIWLGSFYCPFLPLIMILKLIVIFIFKKISVIKFCKPSDWRGGRINTFILFLLFVAFILSFFAVSYSVVFLHPSTLCGPYHNHTTTYSVISDPVREWKENSHTSKISSFFVDILASTAFIVAIFILLCTIAYYTYLSAQTQKQLMQRLQVQLSRDTTDKYYLNKLLKLSASGACIQKAACNNNQ